MSLKIAVEMIVEEMEKEADKKAVNSQGNWDDMVVGALRGYARQFRIALKAAGDAPALHPLPNIHSVPLPPEVQHAQMIEGFRSEFRKEGFTQESRRIKREEQSDPRMVECHGGSFDGTIQPLDPNMPEGAFTRIGGETYKLTGGKLQYQPS